MCNDVSRGLRDEREQLVEGRRFIRKSRQGRCGITQRYLQVGGRDCQRQKTKCAVHNNDDNPRKMNHHHMRDQEHSSKAHNHGGTDMDMNECSSMDGMMMMTFHTGFCETVLFDSWKVSSVGGLVGSMIGIFIMAALYEGLKYYREYLFWKTYNSLQYRAVSLPADKAAGAEDNRIVHMVGEVIHKQPPTMFSLLHGFQTFLHIVQIVLSYFLMLIFMTYNVWLCLAVVVGAAVGYFLFGWKKSFIVDVTEHCH